MNEFFTTKSSKPEPDEVLLFKDLPSTHQAVSFYLQNEKRLRAELKKFFGHEPETSRSNSDDCCVYYEFLHALHKLLNTALGSESLIPITVVEKAQVSAVTAARELNRKIQGSKEKPRISIRQEETQPILHTISLVYRIHIHISKFTLLINKDLHTEFERLEKLLAPHRKLLSHNRRNTSIYNGEDQAPVTYISLSSAL